MRASNKQVMVIVQLAGDPVAVREAAAGHTFSTTEKSSVRTSLKAPQATSRAAHHGLGGRIIGTMQDAYNGIQVYIKASQISKLAALPGVLKVHAVTTYHARQRQRGALRAGPRRVGDPGVHGGTQRIAVIDTGIDYYHANFGGSGDPADFTYGEAHDTAFPAFDADGTTQAFPSAKVIGGYDFAGDAYNADDRSHPGTGPEPARLRRQRGGHGSHTAGTAAGYGVLSNGDDLRRSVRREHTSGNSFLVGPGVAP